jgi:hypothetical protein
LIIPQEGNHLIVNNYKPNKPEPNLLLVAACTTRQQTSASADQKTQQSTQSVGCGCAKGFFPTTTKQNNLNLFEPTEKLN